MRRLSFIAIFLVIALFANGQIFTPIQLQYERPEDSEKIDLYGYDLDINGDTAIVGAFGKQQEKGAVYFYVRNNQTNQWENMQELTAFDNLPSNDFGASVSLYGNFAFVGSLSGAYIYKFNSSSGIWEIHNKLIPEHTSGNLTKVQVNDNFAVLNIPDYANGNLSGYMYIYKYDENSDAWLPLDTIVPEIAADYSKFATDFALSGQNIAISSWYALTNGYSTYISNYHFDGEHFRREIMFEDDDLNMNINHFHIGAAGDSLMSFKGYGLNEQIASFFTMKKNDTVWRICDTLLPTGPVYRSLLNMVMTGDYLIFHYDNGNNYESVYSDIYYYDNGHYQYMSSIIYSEGDEIHNGFGENAYAMSGAKILIGEPYGFSEDGLTRGGFYYYGPNFPAIISSPSDKLNVPENTDVTFSCNALYVTDYQWQISYDNGQTFDSIPEEPPFSNTQTPVLTVNARANLDHTQYRCMLGNEFYSGVYTDTALLTIHGNGIDEPLKSNIDIYPNPVSNILKINSLPDSGTYQCKIIDLNGIIVTKKEVQNNTSLDLSNLPPGVYEIRIKSGTFTKTSKFIKINQ